MPFSSDSHSLFVLCRQLVSSYKGKFGYVHYYVKAQLERPQQAPLECKKSFDVEEPLDVNTPDLLVSSTFTLASFLFII